jgi:hypothetical protein
MSPLQASGKDDERGSHWRGSETGVAARQLVASWAQLLGRGEGRIKVGGNMRGRTWIAFYSAFEECENERGWGEKRKGKKEKKRKKTFLSRSEFADKFRLCYSNLIRSLTRLTTD